MTKQELIDLLATLGIPPSALRLDDVQSEIKETIVLKKFDGDGPTDRTDEPIETIVIENGEIVEHTKRGE